MLAFAARKASDLLEMERAICVALIAERFDSVVMAKESFPSFEKGNNPIGYMQ